MTNKTPITVAYGDGIGPEIMTASLRVLEAAGAQLEVEVIEVGEQVYRSGVTSGIRPEAWESLRRTRVFYKAPITTPLGGGYKSLNVTTRKMLGLYSNVRPCVSYSPYVRTKHPAMDVVIIRENEEDLYAGIEYRHSDEVYKTIKLITRPGSERIIRYAFEFARQNGRRKVTCFTKDNIMKLSDGVFHKVFEEVALEYPDIEAEHMIVDIGAARLADTPEMFDVIVVQNLYGDILSDVAAQLAGSVGMAGSSNIGLAAAMFEAIHGSAPMIAGKNVANPSGLLMAGVLMLIHIGQSDVAERLHNAWLKTLEDGIHTADIYDPAHSQELVGTQEFADAVIERMGARPRHLKAVQYGRPKPIETHTTAITPTKHELIGVDVFIQYADKNPEALGQLLAARVAGDGLALDMVGNRGLKVYPQGVTEAYLSDHWRCRFLAPAGSTADQHQVLRLMGRVVDAGLQIVSSEYLYTFDGKYGFSLEQGQ
ncbi:MAG: NADP-dependent isocitrate dehydrogenase [Anaerolineae bacterium]